MRWQTLFNLTLKQLKISTQPTLASADKSRHKNNLSMPCNHRLKLPSATTPMETPMAMATIMATLMVTSIASATKMEMAM